MKEHSPRITGVSVEDTFMNWGFSLRKSLRSASARSVCDTFRVNRTAWVRKNTLTKRPDLKHTRYAYKPGIQYPAVAVAICPHVFYGPEDRTLRDHDMVVSERNEHYVVGEDFG